MSSNRQLCLFICKIALLIYCLFFLSPANQPHSKVCMPAYLFPFPVSQQTHNATAYDSAISKCLSIHLDFASLCILNVQTAVGR